MHVLGIYSFYDRKAERFDTPFFSLDDLQATRRFHLLLKEEGSIIANWKDEFHLEKIGEFDVMTGRIKELGKVILEGKQIQKELTK